VRIIIYTRLHSSQNETQAELLRKTIEARGDTVVGIIADDPAITGKGKYAGWRSAVSELSQVDQIVVNSAGDLPGKSATDLLKILATLCDHGVSLISARENIDTGHGASAVLDLIAAYHAAKRSEAIRRGIENARSNGKALGRPKVPTRIRRKIQNALQDGAKIRSLARQFKISAGTVLNIGREPVIPEPQAA
jgi:DNA invertase Pin-like site-specific DNA recombinase